MVIVPNITKKKAEENDYSTLSVIEGRSETMRQRPDHQYMILSMKLTTFVSILLTLELVVQEGKMEDNPWIIRWRIILTTAHNDPPASWH